ncbi:MAG: hypothetical protein GC201_01160 [Alphaproteobacteria bacterium]|nr:hypothetical protein [Alphaproteobacteria bacterium]
MSWGIALAGLAVMLNALSYFLGYRVAMRSRSAHDPALNYRFQKNPHGMLSLWVKVENQSPAGWTIESIQLVRPCRGRIIRLMDAFVDDGTGSYKLDENHMKDQVRRAGRKLEIDYALELGGIFSSSFWIASWYDHSDSSTTPSPSITVAKLRMRSTDSARRALDLIIKK